MPSSPPAIRSAIVYDARIAVGPQHEDGAGLAQADDPDRANDAVLERPNGLGDAGRRPARLKVRQQHAEGEAEKQRKADDARDEPGGGKLVRARHALRA